VAKDRCRLPLYEFLREDVLGRDAAGHFPLWKAVAAGMSTGAIAQFLSSPADLLKVKMQMENRQRSAGQESR
jgi:solute carrier family 25 (mitochondrial uncoupling protein), member 27